MPALASIGTSGIQLSLVGSTICLVAFAAYLAKEAGIIKLLAATGLSLIILVISILNIPRWDLSLLSSGISFLSIPKADKITRQDFRRLLKGGANNKGQELLYYQEGSNSTVTVSQMQKSNIIFLKTDGKMEAALPLDNSLPAPTSDKLTHVLLGSLPLILSEIKPDNVLLIGYGSGVTGSSILDCPEVRHLNIAEPEQSILRASRFFRNSVNNYDQLAKAINDGPGRADITLCDARNFLSMLTRNYQVIIAQAGEPWLEGVADLYTFEFWQLARKRLSLEGIFCQWIPLYGIDQQSFARICLTFQAVFPNALLFHGKNAGEVLLIGFNNKLNQKSPLINIAQATSRFETPLIYKDLKDQGINNLAELLSMMALSPKALARYLDTEGHGKLKLNLDDQLDFALPWLLASQGMTISPVLYDSLKPYPFSAEELYCCYGTTNGEKETFMAQLAQAYSDGKNCTKSSATAQALISQLKKFYCNKY